MAYQYILLAIDMGNVALIVDGKWGLMFFAIGDVNTKQMDYARATRGLYLSNFAWAVINYDVTILS